MIEHIEIILNYKFSNKDLLTLALTHKSLHYEIGNRSQGHNEKLEFVGDAVLDLILSELLMETFPSDDEGKLSKKRASLVNESVLSKLALKLNLAQFIKLGKGELLSGGQEKPRILASFYEALLGAVYFDGGFIPVRNLVREHFTVVISETDFSEDFVLDYKTRFQELAQSKLKITPTYFHKEEFGPPHNRIFVVEVKVGDKVFAQGQGKSKKQAEQDSARVGLIVLEQKMNEGGT